MDLFLFLAGFVLILIAIGLLLVRTFTKEPKKKMFILLGFGLVVMTTGALIGGANMTPEDKTAVEEKRLAKAEAKEAKLEAERLKKERADEEKKKMQEEQTESDKAEKDASEKLEVEKERKEKEFAEQKEREQLASKEATEKAEAEKLENEQVDKVNNDSNKINEKKDKTFNIYDLADRNLETIVEILGEGEEVDYGNEFQSSNGTIYSVKSFSFQDGLVEIDFLDGKAGSISIIPKEKYKFDEKNVEKALKAYGFPESTPHSETRIGLFYSNINSDKGNLYDVTVFNKNGDIHYIYILTQEKYK